MYTKTHTYSTTEEPERGRAEKTLTDAFQSDETYVYSEKLTLDKIKKLVKIPTVLLAFAQGLPGSLPWGVLFTFFQVCTLSLSLSWSAAAAPLFFTILERSIDRSPQFSCYCSRIHMYTHI